MNTTLLVLLTVPGVIVAVGLILAWIYNSLTILFFRAKEALSDIDVQLKRRYDLIPNLVETVKGYMTHEKGVLESVTKARASIASAEGGPLVRAEKEEALTNTLKTLFAVSENYPELKANANFLDLQREIADTENKIQASRRFYNAMTRDLNTKIKTFPSNLVAKIFNFKDQDFFATDSEEEKQPVKVKF
jgi:LemA protein